MQKSTIHIKGMHCRSCEILIEDELLKVPQVCSVKVSHSSGVAEVFYEGKPKDKDIENAINEAGYSIGIEEKTFYSKKVKDYTDLLACGGVLLTLYLIASSMGIFNLSINSGSNYSNLGLVLILGLTAGISTCMALVGGLVLGASAKFAEKHPKATTMQKFTPHIFFNLGRIISFFILGGMIGFAGSFFQLSITALGYLTVFVGFVMLMLGFQLIEIFPGLNKYKITLPKGLTRLIGLKETSSGEYSHRNSAILGALTFFLPCGFTQAMQLYAISTGDPLAGALTMGVFAIGTAPGLLGVGGLTAIVKGAFAKMFFKTVGLAVIGLAVFNLSNGLTLAGIEFVVPSSEEVEAQAADPNVTLENGVQIVRMTQTSNGYNPSKFTIQKGIPVKWIINSKDSNSCASSIVSSSLNIRKGLKVGENVFEFTPIEAGTLKFSCIMGMFAGSFKVVDGTNSTASQSQSNNSGVPKVVNQDTPQQTNKPQFTGEVQSLKAVYTQYDDISPNNFIVKIGVPVRLEIEAKDDGGGCMGSVAIPRLSDQIEIFEKGKTVTFEFLPEKAGRYPITCAMGVPRGVITVQ